MAIEIVDFPLNMVDLSIAMLVITRGYCCLVVDLPLWKIVWDDYSQYMETWNMLQTTNQIVFFGWNIMGNYHIRRNTMIILWETNYKFILIQLGHPGISLWDTMRILYNRNIMGYPQQSMDNILRISMGISSTGYSADMIQVVYHGILLKWDPLTGKIWFRSNKSKLKLPINCMNVKFIIIIQVGQIKHHHWEEYCYPKCQTIPTSGASSWSLERHVACWSLGRSEISDRVSPCIRRRKKGGQFGGLTYFHIYIYKYM